MSEWISVKDRLPEYDEHLRFYDDGVLRFTTVIVSNNGSVDIANRIMIRENLSGLLAKDWHWSMGHNSVTHWMPIPEPPKGEEA